MSDPRIAGDAAAISVGWLTLFADAAGKATPILSFIFLSLSIVWILWRMIDRWRHGAGGRSSGSGDDA